MAKWQCTLNCSFQDDGKNVKLLTTYALPSAIGYPSDPRDRKKNIFTI